MFEKRAGQILHSREHRLFNRHPSGVGLNHVVQRVVDAQGQISVQGNTPGWSSSSATTSWLRQNTAQGTEASCWALSQSKLPCEVLPAAVMKSKRLGAVSTQFSEMRTLTLSGTSVQALCP